MSVGLVESKLLRPRLPSGVVPRPRVTAALERAAEHAVVLVSAPAGYGKTVAVASWLAERPAGWVSLDAADDDPVRLWTYAAAALGVPLGEGPLEAAIDRLAARGVPLVLEDVHVLREPACLATLGHAARVFERLVLITRTDPQIGLGRLRAHGALGEVRAPVLAFTAAEATLLLGGDVDADAIVARTEGWPAAVYLVRLWLRGGGDADRLPTRYLSEYLTTEVLAGLSGGEREFLRCTSVLARLSPELCDHVLGRDDSAARLAALVRANLFVVALDEHDGWFRCHDLVRELLRPSLPADEAAKMARRAATWFAERGLIEPAVEHTLEAGDVRGVAELVDRHHMALLRTGRAATLVRWLSALPETELARWPSLPVAGAFAAASVNRPRTEVERLTAAAERARSSDNWSDYHEVGFAVLKTVTDDGDVPAMAVAAEHAVALASADDDLTGEYAVVALAALAQARMLVGDEQDAERAAAAAAHHPLAPRRPHGLVSALAVLATVRAERGHVAAARECADQALAEARRSGNAEARAGGRAQAADAVVALAEGRLEQAARAGERAVALLGPGASRAQAQLVLVRTHAARGELRQARAVLAQAWGTLHECPDAGVVPARAERLGEELAAARSSPPGEPVSAAERLVLEQLASGRSNAEIASVLFLSPNTIKTHLRAIYTKLGVHSREAAVARARALGLLDSPG
ncbi:LuxR C-terminal-related transcriptional regulator [Solirubrobacter taibaiensis]|nr:LuxR C-terminal-related transcriptional regulator [Solirubrobacter taibaiensis]